MKGETKFAAMVARPLIDGSMAGTNLPDPRRIFRQRNVALGTTIQITPFSSCAKLSSSSTIGHVSPVHPANTHVRNRDPTPLAQTARVEPHNITETCGTAGQDRVTLRTSSTPSAHNLSISSQYNLPSCQPFCSHCLSRSSVSWRCEVDCHHRRRQHSIQLLGIWIPACTYWRRQHVTGMNSWTRTFKDGKGTYKLARQCSRRRLMA